MRNKTLILSVLWLGCGTGGQLDKLPAFDGSTDAQWETDADPLLDYSMRPDTIRPEADGRSLYIEHCVTCHGLAAEGITGPALDPWAERRDALIDRIDRTMPPGVESNCVHSCAQKVADYVINLVEPPMVACADAPQRLRLLSHREYVQSVEALLFDDVSPCPMTRFEFTEHLDAGGVHVAGDFNDWAPTLADGGWPMIRSGERWSLERQLESGRYRYKYVIDEQDWVSDPNQPSEPDGFGGNNSIVEVICGDRPAAPDVSELLSAETRPAAFPFDNHAQTARVDTVRFEAYLAAAARYAQAVGPICQSADCFVGQLLPKIFRRLPTVAETERYRALYAEGPALALEAALASPSFLYRTELNEILSQEEIATALAYFLWGSSPDAQLMANDRLRTPNGRIDAARRLLNDPRGQRTIGHFAGQWLGVAKVATVDKSAASYPDFDPALRALFLDETQRFVQHIVLGSGAFDDLLTADYTLGPPTLAAHYGLEAHSERISYNGRRAGILGHGSILATYAHSDQSSPIRRGLFVRRTLLCQPLPPPPPNAGGVPDVDPNATTRERFRQHTDDPFCASCHQYIDDLGFGFEHFDAVGAWREHEGGQPINAAGNLNDINGLGTNTSSPFNSLPELGATLTSTRTAADCFVTQVFRFAQGREETPADRCTIAELQSSFDESGDDIPQLLEAIVAHPSFIRRRAP